MKLLRTTALTAALMTAAVPALTTPANAWWRGGGWGWGGLGIGIAAAALIGGAMAASSYGYGYGYPGYGYGYYGYPLTGMATATDTPRPMAMPVTAMVTRLMAMGRAITAVTDTAITPLSAMPMSGVTGATKESRPEHALSSTTAW
jgi:hypothetical protein